MDIIRQDFDRLAAFEADRWGHNSHYYPYLLRQLPASCGTCLEIGCGAGSFARLLASRSERVLAVDLSPQMIRLAQQQSGGYPNIEYRVADVLQMDLAEGTFDGIASIATLHHLPMETMLVKMSGALRTGGVLLVLDLFKGEGLGDYARSAIAVPANVVLTLVKTGSLRRSREDREAWAEHGKHDRYLPVSRIRSMCQDLLPGAILRKHLFWRYSLVWQKKESMERAC